jgi:hypothetical protein
MENQEVIRSNRFARFARKHVETIPLRGTPDENLFRFSPDVATRKLPADWPALRSVRHWHEHKAALGLPIPVTKVLTGIALDLFTGENAVMRVVRPRYKAELIGASDRASLQIDFAVRCRYIPDGFARLAITSNTFGVLVEDQQLRAVDQSFVEIGLHALSYWTSMQMVVVPALCLLERSGEFFGR